MNRAKWDRWCKATGAKKAAILSALVTENEPLVQKCAQTMAQTTRLYVKELQDDMLQAARIGLLRAIEKWDPKRGAFSSIAWYWMRHEIQQVTRHATQVTLPKSAFMPKRKQEEAGVFFAKYGRDPAPEEIGVSPSAVHRAECATRKMVPVSKYVPAAGTLNSLSSADALPDEDIDRKRDARALQAFVVGLPPKARKEFWASTRHDLITKAKAFIEAARVGGTYR
jgi:RNA polymerase sigma factor (sigma-70 family)